MAVSSFLVHFFFFDAKEEKMNNKLHNLFILPIDAHNIGRVTNYLTCTAMTPFVFLRGVNPEESPYYLRFFGLGPQNDIYHLHLTDTWPYGSYFASFHCKRMTVFYSSSGICYITPSLAAIFY